MSRGLNVMADAMSRSTLAVEIMDDVPLEEVILGEQLQSGKYPWRVQVKRQESSKRKRRVFC